MTSFSIQKLRQQYSKHLDKSVLVRGWIRSVRKHRHCSFIELNDGSGHRNLQLLVEGPLSESLSVGCSITAQGVVKTCPVKHKGTETGETDVELHTQHIDLVGSCDAAKYPLAKKYHTLEHLRNHLHLRARTSTFGAVARVRNALSWSIHQTFQKDDFLQMHTPIITSNDAEGAGEQFQVQNGKEPFFGKPAYLTVSGQLHAETYACALSKVYTFGPTFRAEQSNTGRHLAEFWMVEPEMAFSGMDECCTLAQNVVQNALQGALDTCLDDLTFFQKTQEENLLNRLETTVKMPTFPRMTYTEAIAVLEKVAKTASFTYPISWGQDLHTEHERYLAEEYVNGPLFVTDYPASIKPFYMKSNDDAPPRETVACFDLLVPRVGELIGGSVREDRPERLHLPDSSLEWYADLRRFGTVPHAGWGLGFERLVLYATGLKNIRDVIPMPRTPGSCPA